MFPLALASQNALCGRRREEGDDAREGNDGEEEGECDEKVMVKGSGARVIMDGGSRTRMMRVQEGYYESGWGENDVWWKQDSFGDEIGMRVMMVNGSEMRVMMVGGRGVGDVCNIAELGRVDDDSVLWWWWWWQYGHEDFEYDDVFVMW
jgi:hypothetical protein